MKTVVPRSSPTHPAEVNEHLGLAMARYRALEDDLRLIRAEQALGSPAEDPILEEMARVWWLLSDIERLTLDREGPTCDPETIESTDDLQLVDKDTVADASSPWRKAMNRPARDNLLATSMTPKLKLIDLARGEGSKHPDIREGKSYLAQINGEYHAGEFSKQWYGWNFDGWSHNPCGLQYDTPGTNCSKWQGLWEILPAIPEHTMITLPNGTTLPLSEVWEPSPHDAWPTSNGLTRKPRATTRKKPPATRKKPGIARRARKARKKP